jgi:hypothetical protein
MSSWSDEINMEFAGVHLESRLESQPESLPDRTLARLESTL